MVQTKGASVYLYYSGSGALVYVGVTDRGTRRMHEHADSKPWWHLVTGCAIEHYPSRAQALAREADVIRRFRPAFNIQHNPDRDVAEGEKIAKTGMNGSAAVLFAAGLPDFALLSLKERRRLFARLTLEQKRVFPCIVCGQRPDPRGKGTCPSCRTKRVNRHANLTAE